MNHTSLRFLEQLVSIPSPSYGEFALGRCFEEHVRPYADDTLTDAYGNVYATLNAAAPFRLMLAAHLDEVGYMVHRISDEGFLSIKPIGDQDPAVAIGQNVSINARSPVHGVIARTPAHQLSESRKSQVTEFKDLYVDIGVTSRSAAENLVNVGDLVTVDGALRRLQEEIVVGRGLDDKVGLFIIAEVLRHLSEGEPPTCCVTCVGTVQEEVGHRGAYPATLHVLPHLALAVDVSNATDYPHGDDPDLSDLRLGRGAVVARGANVNPAVFRTLSNIATLAGIDIQVEAEVEYSATDASVMESRGLSVATGIVGVAMRYMHSPCEMVDLHDVEACIDLLVRFCQTTWNADSLLSQHYDE